MPLIPDNPKSTIPLPNMQITTSFTTASVALPVGTIEARIAVDKSAWPLDSVMTVTIELSQDAGPFNAATRATFVAGEIGQIGVQFNPPTAAGLRARGVIDLTGSPIQLVGNVKLY